MSTKNPFFVPPPTDYQSFGSGRFLISYGGSNIKISMNGGNSWQYLPPNINLGQGVPKSVTDSAANENSKSFTVPTGKLWKINIIWAFFATTATAGTRVLEAKFLLDGGTGTAAQFTSGIDHAASTTGRTTFALSLSKDSGYRSGTATCPMAPNLLGPADVLTIYDVSNVDGNDDMVVRINLIEYSTLNPTTLTIEASDLLLSWNDSFSSGSEQSLSVLKID